MTEDEAKTKWCPPSWGYSMPSRCVGANCMAWRATEGVARTRIETGGQIVVATGYCGLAGSPTP